MRASRNFRLSRTDSVLMPPVVGQSIARGVIAGEACTELGCEASPIDRSWLAKWLGIGRTAGSEQERKDHGTQS
jgi:hypothetical protein